MACGQGPSGRAVLSVTHFLKVMFGLETLTHDRLSHLTWRTGAHDRQLQAGTSSWLSPQVGPSPGGSGRGQEGLCLSPGGWEGQYLLRPL